VKLKKKIAAFAAALALVGPPAAADEREELEALRQTTLKLIDLLVEQGILTREKADQLIKQAQEAGAAEAKKKAEEAAAGAKPGVVRVPYVPQTVRDEMTNEIKQDVLTQARSERWGEPGALPEWLNRFAFFGDLRLRFQRNYYASGNAPFLLDPQATNQSGSLQLLNTQSDNSSFRIRARLGANVTINDWLTAGLRISTGNLTTPVSANLDQANYFNRYAIALDWAYLQADPVDWLTAAAGRFPNPFLNTELVWAPDLGFTGGYVKFKPRLGEGMRAVITAGAFPLQDSDLTPSNNKWLYAGQAGLQWEGSGARGQLAVAYYDYDNIVGIANPIGSTQFNSTAPLFMQKGNTIFNINAVDPTRSPLFALASKYQLVDVIGVLDLPAFSEQRFILTGDYIKNVGFSANQASANVGSQVSAETTGWQVSALLGRPELRKRGDWVLAFSYNYLQADATLDAFTSGDFHLGGTNAKGYILSAAYAFDRNFWLSARWYSADQVSGPPLGIDVLQIDLNARF
jgi:hypothetical protein